MSNLTVPLERPQVTAEIVRRFAREILGIDVALNLADPRRGLWLSGPFAATRENAGAFAAMVTELEVEIRVQPFEYDADPRWEGWHWVRVFLNYRNRGGTNSCSTERFFSDADFVLRTRGQAETGVLGGTLSQ